MNTFQILFLSNSIQLIYELWSRHHNRFLTTKVNTMNESDFVCKLLYIVQRCIRVFLIIFVAVVFEARINI